jgi:outer membrane lipoprotein SlyB
VSSIAARFASIPVSCRSAVAAQNRWRCSFPQHLKEDEAMRTHAILPLLLIGLLSACVSTAGKMYSPSDARRPWTVQEATVVQVNEAVIDGRETAVGTVGGGLIGYTLGHAMGGGSGSAIIGAVGAVAGAVAGQKVEKAATQQKAWEILVDVEDGVERLAIVQPADQNFVAGEKVRIYTRSDGTARVAKL